MKYDTTERRMIRDMSGQARVFFRVIEREEKSESIWVGRLCSALMNDPRFILFSCLAGDGEREELAPDLGTLFTSRLKQRVLSFVDSLHVTGYARPSILVIIDDTEPVRVWQWKMSQEEVTTWYRMVISDTGIPFGWKVKLWSDIEKEYKTHRYYFPYKPPYTYEQCWVDGKFKGSHTLWNLYQYTKRLPNKKFKTGTDLRMITLNRQSQYQRQGHVLSGMWEGSILIQTETPWEIKDPLFWTVYALQTNSMLPIIHPFSEGRR